MKEKKKIMKKVDKLVMGAIIGGAIGSVIGATYKNRKSPMEGESGTVDSEGEKPKKKSLLRRMLRRIFYGKKEKN